MTKKFDQDSFLFAGNGAFIEDLYLKYLESPQNVDEYWQNFFSNLAEDQRAALHSIIGASWLPRKNKIILPPEAAPAPKSQKTSVQSNKTANINLLIADYRAHGHLLTSLDPLGLEKLPNNIKLDPSHYGLSESDLDTEIELNHLSLGLDKCTIRQLIDRLKIIYCSSIGYEINHLVSDEEKEWFYQHIEQMKLYYSLSKNEKIEALKDLIDVEGFEQFIHTRFPGTKRFSVEGGETSILAVKEIIKIATSRSKVEEVLIGMAHRGRLNMLTKIIGKDYAAMLSEFQGNLAHMEELNISGD
ncbi:MAG: 2-oxoglutarate dehydrogenase E1 component, partial [Pseudomonadota bacterium]